MASNEPETETAVIDAACQTARRESRKKMLEYCGTREQKVHATARDMGLVSEGETLTLDADALLGSTIESPTEQRKAALAAVWYDNPETGEALIDQHGGDYAAALAEAWTVVDGLFDPGEPESVEVQPLDDDEADEADESAQEADDETVEPSEEEETAQDGVEGVSMDDADVESPDAEEVIEEMSAEEIAEETSVDEADATDDDGEEEEAAEAAEADDDSDAEDGDD